MPISKHRIQHRLFATALTAGFVLGAAGVAEAASAGSSAAPGLLSGNNVQVKVDAPVNACGNSVNVGGAGNPAGPSNHCTSSESPKPSPVATTPAPRHSEAVAPAEATPPAPVPTTPSATPRQLAHTGSGRDLEAAGVAVVVLAGGALLYRGARRRH